MKTGLKRGLAVGLGVCMAASMLAGCGKKETLDTAAVAATFDGEEISAGLVNFYLRYQQAEFESSYGSWLSSYYGTNIWDADLTGTGVAYGETFKDDVMTSLERLLLAEKHMADYSVELTDEEKAAITQAAQDFMAANDEEVLEKMSATQENVERILTLSTIQNKVETGMVADVDTEVSDEEAAQRTVSYVRFTAETESDTEAETESGSEAQTEGASEAETAGEMETEGETEAETAGETETEAAAETETEAEDATEAALTEAEGTKTQAADEETESETAETEADTEEVTEAAEEETQEQDADTEAEAATEAETEIETETETEDPAMEAAREDARAQAEAFLEQVKGGEDFETAAAAAAEENENVGTSDFTFGDNDTYPDEAIIEATKGLEDGTLVEEPVQVNDAFYVLYVDDAFDEEATEEEKDNIVTQRKSDAINALYEEWMEDVEFTVNDEVYDEMLFDLSLTLETEAVTEAETEAASESQSEAETEAASEAETEAASEAETEAVSGSQSEAETEAVSESQSEEVTEEAAEASADAEAETEAETQTEEVTEAETETEEVTEA